MPKTGSPPATGVSVSRAAVTGASKYRMEVRAGDRASWTTDRDTLTGTTHTVDALTCGTGYQFRVRAHGRGGTYAAAWSAPSAAVTLTTAACTPPVFDAASYAFRLFEAAPAGTVAGTVTARDGGGAVTYALPAGTADGRFTIHPASGEVTLAAALDRPAGTAFALTVAATDAGGRAATAAVTVTVTAYAVDYDADDDGLIEVASLAQLDAIRWDLDGDGTAADPGYAAAFPDAPAGMGCPASGCTGYELTRDLDFDTSGDGTADAADAYWNGGAGWAPLGAADGPAFTATLEGNGHRIAHLFIARPTTAEVGLLGQLGAGGVLRHLGLRAAAVTGGDETGGLVGENIRGAIHASYVSGRVTGQREVGGLVGRLVSGTITASYASSAVTGRGWATGGLVGISVQGTIRAAYARGPVTGQQTVGGLVGHGDQATITASYAAGAVTGTAAVGGLAGRHTGPVTASYWDTTTSGQAASAAGAGQPTAALQAPTSATGLYAAWNLDLDGDGAGDAPWDFGTAAQYPALRVDANGDGQATWRELGAQRAGNRAPAFPAGAATTRAVAEGTAEGAHIGAPLTATDPDGDTLAYALGGADAAAFGLDGATGQLKTKAALDYETRTSYAVTVTARDAAGGQAAIAVTIRVTNAPDTAPPAPANLAATAAVTSLALSWDAVAGAGAYRVETRAGGTATWTTQADDLTGTTPTVAALPCGTAYEVRVSALGDGTIHAATWGAASGTLAAATSACPPPVFDAAAPSFSVNEAAAIGTLAGTLTATTSSADAVTYAITAGNTGDALALASASGHLTVAGALDRTATPTYTLTVRASAGGASATTAVTVTVTARVQDPRPALEPPTDVTVSSGAPGALTVGWGGSAHATSFVLFATPVDGEAQHEAVLGGEARSHTFTGLAAGTYQVIVIAQQTVGDHYQDMNASSATVDVAGAA